MAMNERNYILKLSMLHYCTDRNMTVVNCNLPLHIRFISEVNAHTDATADVTWWIVQWSLAPCLTSHDSYQAPISDDLKYLDVDSR